MNMKDMVEGALVWLLGFVSTLLLIWIIEHV